MSSLDPWIPLARPAIGDAERAAADRALLSGNLVNGPETLRFEAALAERCGRAHAVCVASGSAALELSLWALGLAPGDEVLVTGFGSVAATHAIARAGGIPVAVDVERPTWNLDVGTARAVLSPRTRGVVSSDQLGLAAEPEPIEAFAAEHGLWVIDDAARGLGAVTSTGAAAGGFGRIATLAFDPGMVITTGEGGAALTDDGDLAEALRQLRDHGRAGGDRVRRVGTNARLSEVAAAIGGAQLARLDAVLAERRLLARGYHQRLARLGQADAISWQDPVASAMHAYQTFAVDIARHQRAAVIAHMAERAIHSGGAGHAVARVPGCPPRLPTTPVALELHERALALPLYSGMRSGELDRVADALTEVLS